MQVAAWNAAAFGKVVITYFCVAPTGPNAGCMGVCLTAEVVLARIHDCYTAVASARCGGYVSRQGLWGLLSTSSAASRNLTTLLLRLLLRLNVDEGKHDRNVAWFLSCCVRAAGELKAGVQLGAGTFCRNCAGPI